MESIVTSTGIVLSRRKDRETDIVFDLMRENGSVVRLRAHGIVATKNRSGLIHEPGSKIQATYYDEDSRGGSLKEATLLDRREGLKESYTDMTLLSYVLEISRHASEGSPDPDLYRLLDGALETLNQENKKRTVDDFLSFIIFYKTRLMKVSGFLGETDRCSHCGAPLEGEAYLNRDELSFTCKNCEKDANHQDRIVADLLNRGSRLRYERFLESLGNHPIGPEILNRVNRSLDDFSDQHFPLPRGRKQFYEAILL